MASPSLSPAVNNNNNAHPRKDRKMSIDGYTSNVFEGKPAQMAQVAAFIAQQGFLPAELIEAEVAWFYKYFLMEGVESISNHITSLYAAKMIAFTKKNDQAYFNINLEQESETGAVYIHNSRPGVSVTDGPNYERRIDEKFLNPSFGEKSFRMESYRSSGQVSAAIKAQLRCYFVAKCDFVCPRPTGEDAKDIHQVSDRTFLSKASSNTLEVYQRIMNQALECTGPVIEAFDVEGSRDKRIVIGYRQGSINGFFSSMSDLYHYYELYSTRKYVENFSNGITIMTLYLSPLPDSQSRVPIEHSITQILKEASLIYCVPQTPLQALFQTGQLSIQEAIYGYSGLIFCQHFLNRLGSEYQTLSKMLDPGNAQHVEVLLKLKKRLRQETFTREYVLEIVRSYPELIRQLYINFAMTHYTSTSSGQDLKPSLSYQRIQKDKVLTDDELLERIRKTVCNQHELMVFESLLTFNRHILKTNFYRPFKVALSFRLDPAFLPSSEYPQRPFGMFLVIGAEFRGFHVRFRDVARGGIRIIRSRNREAYSINLRSLFDENYALASTQQRKNKDIPEGGSKGTILLDISAQDKAQNAFEKYVDAILDLLLSNEVIKDCGCLGDAKIVDKLQRTEILFFGPDEGTADYMDWASQHARRRGASFWKAFTTGKSQSLGGIPHDLFGMTTRSIHQYVTGIYAKLGLDESGVSKFQTGGPDGDLGSNEIKISHDRTVAIVDGSGVLYDPQGLDRAELAQLAQKRQMICNFSLNKLNPAGFRVLIDERDVKLPTGELIEDGLKFRNEFHLHPLSTADLFVPCGGRPEAVDINNVQQLFHYEGDNLVPRFKYIVEGANLFFTQEARFRLEAAGVIIFKDASANKGGVTSSSLEVLAALAFTDEEFSANMQVTGGVVPQFYQDYIKSVHATIERNAQLEFECLWREHERFPDKPRSQLSDELSLAIVRLNEELQHSSSLFDNRRLRLLVLSEALPQLLQDRLGLEELIDVRLPENYVRACFGSYLASRFIYQYGTQPSQFSFFEFMSERYFCRFSLKGKHRPSASQWPMPLSPWSDLRREVSDGYASSPGSASPPPSAANNGSLRRRKGKGKLVDSEYSIPVLSSEERFSEGTESPLTVPGKGITFVDARVLEQIGIAETGTGGSRYSDGGCTEELFWIRRDSSIPDYDTSRMERK